MNPTEEQIRVLQLAGWTVARYKGLTHLLTPGGPRLTTRNEKVIAEFSTGHRVILRGSEALLTPLIHPGPVPVEYADRHAAQLHADIRDADQQLAAQRGAQAIHVTAWRGRPVRYLLTRTGELEPVPRQA